MNAWGRAFAALTIVWAVALPVATFAASRHSLQSSDAGSVLALLVYGVGSLICHQRPERSFQLLATTMPVCARCTGIYAGAALAAIVVALRPSLVSGRAVIARSAARGVLIASILPAAATL